MQNLGARKGKEIRSAILAPPGYTIVAVDAAQIEARLTAWLAGELSLLQQFANGEDVYRNFATEIFRVKDARDITKVQRFIGKTLILGLGFGMSDGKLFYTINNLARDQGIDVSWIAMKDCIDWVQVYRRKFFRIKNYWNTLGRVIELMAQGAADGITIGPCVVDGTTIIGPGGLRLYYEGLYMDDQREYWYKYGQFTKKIYGGKLTENVVQHLDRQHVVEAGIRTEIRARELGIPDPRVLLNVHDENVHCVPDEYAHTMALVALGEMRRNASWSEGLPLNAEVKLGKNFGEMEEYRPDGNSGE
jgi:DNA polymerase